MIVGLLTLFACQLTGEFIVHLFDVPVPGAVVGMVLLLLGLKVMKPAENGGLVRTCQRLLDNMQLLFVPAGVGVVQYLGVIGAALGPIVAGLVVSWIAALVVTALVATGALAATRSRLA